MRHLHYFALPTTRRRRSQPTMFNGYVSSILDDHTRGQTICPPLPSSVQFDNNSGGANLLKPTVSLVSCDMTLIVTTKRLKVLVAGCVKQQMFRRVKFLCWFAWTIWPPSRFRVRHGMQIQQCIPGWNELELVVWNSRKYYTHPRKSSQQLHQSNAYTFLWWVISTVWV